MIFAPVFQELIAMLIGVISCTAKASITISIAYTFRDFIVLFVIQT